MKLKKIELLNEVLFKDLNNSFLSSLSEIIGGMLDLDPRFWRNPRREIFEVQKQKVIRFGGRFKSFDFTRKPSSSSSESESD